MARRRYKASRKPRRTSRLRKAIKAEIHRNIENKNIVRQTNNAPVSFPCIANIADPDQGFPSFAKNLVPSISQGTGQGSRVGNVVNLRRASLNISFNIRPYDQANNNINGPWEVLFMIVKYKRSNTQLTEDIAFDQLFQFGGTYTGATNKLTDKFLDINKDVFQLKYKRVIKLGFAGNVVSGTVNTTSNNDYSLARTLNVNIGKMLKKRMQYNDNLVPINDNLWAIAFAYSPQNDFTVTELPIFSQQPVELHCVEKWIYEDA